MAGTPSLRSRFFTASGSKTNESVKKNRPSLRMSEKTLRRSPRAVITASIRVRSGSDSGFGDEALLLQVRQHAFHLFFEREGFHPLPLDPEQLVLIVAGGRAVDPLERELLDQLGPREDLLRAVEAPAQPRKIIQERVGQVAFFDVLVNIDQDAELFVFGDLALGHLRLRARLGHERNVAQCGQSRHQGLEKQELRECV